MKPSEKCKLAGLKSLAELAEITGESVQTLNNWHKNKPRFFDIVLAGTIEEKRRKGMKPEIVNIIEQIRRIENEETLLCEHGSWGAAEGATKRKCYQIERLLSMVTPGQREEIEKLQGKNFLAYIAKGPDYNGPYPSSADAIEKVFGS